MSGGSLELLKRQVSQRPAPGNAETLPPPEPEDEAECPCFAYLRGVRERSPSIEFRRAREGDSFCFPYSWLGPCRHHPSTGITMIFVGSELYLVTLRGRNLNKLTDGGISLYDRGLVRHRITWVREVKDEQSRAIPRDECVVERIEVKAVTPEEAARALGMGKDVG